MTRQQQKIGQHGQDLAAATLRGLGIRMVEKIGTPVHLIPSRVHMRGESQTYQVIYGEKVSGDHRGILPGGRSVLVEVKTILDRNLRWSDLREHQPERLTEHADLGGLSLLVWIHHTGVYVMRFPMDGFKRGNSLTIAMASAHDTVTRNIIEDLIDEFQSEKLAE